ncbi:MAG: LysR family transcriptional regulator [Candidatus Krumholzibacteriota bacterium]|nr:LysR family transcriptional regulator [Candidatus Krumholzibacteriota bacterium]
MNELNVKPGMRLFLQSKDGKGLIGDGRFKLLKEVRDTGSIMKAAESLGRGYRKAWEDIRKVEEGFGREVVVKNRGGSEGGSTHLTEFGLRLIEAWEEYRKDISLYLEDSFRRNIKGLIRKGGKNGQ